MVKETLPVWLLMARGMRVPNVDALNRQQTTGRVTVAKRRKATPREFMQG